MYIYIGKLRLIACILLYHNLLNKLLLLCSKLDSNFITFIYSIRYARRFCLEYTCIHTFYIFLPLIYICRALKYCVNKFLKYVYIKTNKLKLSFMRNNF